jgi:hypothetical protein
VCDRLRSDPRSCAVYIERAEGIEAELNLSDLCGAIEDLGERDTFPFEERTFLRTAIKGIVTGETDATRRVLTRQKSSVWLGKGESQAQWDLIRAGLSLVEACDDFERQLPEHARSQAELIDFYLGSLREADRLQREFEQAAGDFLDQHGLMHEVIGQARARYRRLAEKVQGVFVKHVESSGWPPAGRLANADAFDRLVADRLKENGRKVAYLMVDALRYELGVALEKLLAEDGPVELQAAYAQLPTITLVGMASLLPGARTGLTLSLENDALVPKLAGTSVSYFKAGGDEVVVFCPESKDAIATQEPARRKLRQSEGQPTEPAEQPPAVQPAPTAQAAHAEPTVPEAAAPVSPVAAPAPSSGPKEQHFTILYGDTGYSYESIMGPYLQGAKAVVIEDPYIRLQHQIQNFVRFCETVLKAGTVKRITLITGHDDKTPLAEMAEKLEELKQSLLEVDVELEVKLNPNIHDREIRLDNGWTIKIGRGLDFYQKPSSWFEVGAHDLNLRKCLETKVDIFQA